MISQLFLQLTLPLMIAILIATFAVVLPRSKRPREIGRPIGGWIALNRN